MNKLPFLAFLGLAYASAFGQTCTITGTGTINWPADGSGISCSEGGTAAGKSTLVIPAGVTVVFDNNTDTWTGTSIEVYGTLEIPASPTINSSVVVNSGGRVNVTGKLSLGSSGGCPYNVVVRTGGVMDLNNTGSSRLAICGNDIMTGNGSCNDCGGTYSAQCARDPNKAYCEPPGGITGPSGYDFTGYNASLPVELLYFLAAQEGERVRLSWATSAEENFYKFIVQRSGQGLIFEDIGEVEGKGFNIYNTKTDYSFMDDVPLSGFNYYRLKALDLDESFEYFGVKAVKIDEPNKIAVFPNPVSGQVISFKTNFSPSESDRLILTNELGVEIFNGGAAVLQNRIFLEDTPGPGVYLLRYVSKDFQETARVVFKD